MTLRVATVLSAREWEPDLVAHARETAAVRVVLRAYQPQEIEERAEEIDIVIAGAEVAWVTPGRIATWRRMGLGVVGGDTIRRSPEYSSTNHVERSTDGSRLC